MEFTYSMLYEAWEDVVTMTSIESNRVKFRYLLEPNLAQLREELNNGTFQPSPLRNKKITYPKVRIAQVPSLRDKVVQIAMYRNGLYDMLSKPLIDGVSACIIDRGDDYASSWLKRNLIKYKNKNGLDFYCLKCDIKSYFGSIPHNRLFEIIDRYVTDESFKDILIKFINLTDDGISLGLPQSQALANLYLSDLDHRLKERYQVEFYGRHMDDFYIIGNDKKQLEYYLFIIENYVKAVGLKLNPKTCIYHNKVEFLGFRYFFNENGKIIKRLLPVKRRSKRRELNKKLKMVQSGSLGVENFLESYNGWRVHALRGNCHSLVTEWDKWLTEKLLELGYNVTFRKRSFYVDYSNIEPSFGFKNQIKI